MQSWLSPLFYFLVFSNAFFMASGNSGILPFLCGMNFNNKKVFRLAIKDDLVGCIGQ